MPPAFKLNHADAYGLLIKIRDPQSSVVTSVACRFCIAFGKEESIGRKRKATSNVKYFNTFREDHYVSHLVGQHPTKWNEYKELQSEDERNAFFTKVSTPFINTLDSHFDEEQSFSFLVNKSIVEVIIGQLLFHPDDVDGISHEQAMSIFKRLEDESGVDNSADYTIYVNKFRQFSLCIKFIACGATFRMASRLIQSTVDSCGFGYLRCINGAIAANYARVACSVSLQLLSDLLSNVWAFAIALDCSTHQATSYLDVRCRFFFNGDMQNFHLLAIPLFERHTGENMFKTLAVFMDALCPSWKQRVISVSTDGDRSMTGHISGMSTRIEQVATPGFIRIWCGLHQLDLVMQRVFVNALDEEFLGQLTSLIGYLRRQQSLISEMRTTCPKVAGTRWLSMGAVAKWFKTHRVAVQEYLDLKKPACAPSSSWWIFLYAIGAIAEQADIVFKSLQGLTTLISQQRAQLQQLVTTYCDMTLMTGPLSPGDIAALSSDEYVVNGSYVLSKAHARGALEGLGVWVCQTVDGLSAEELDTLVMATASAFTQLAQEISAIVAERDSSNQAADGLPPVIPVQLVKLTMRQFVSFYNAHLPRLQHFYSNAQLELISQQFVEFQSCYRKESVFRRVINNSEAKFSSLDFKQAWAITDDRFPLLMQYCGGLASVFPNTATVESDFSVLGYEKDPNRSALTDFSLEGILHAKQFTSLQKLPCPSSSSA
jgi:hypothetical protein